MAKFWKCLICQNYDTVIYTEQLTLDRNNP